MLRKIGRVLLVIFIILVVIGILGAGIAPPLTRRAAQKSFPQIEGVIQLAGLDGPVDVYRDSMGVPHIYATTQHDLFFAQGYVHAQDRFWQMDFWRHQGAGRLSELLGSNLLDTDKFLRTLGWERVAKEEMKNLDATSRAILESYAEGVNTYLADHSGTELALEYGFLPLLNRSYQPAPWTLLNTMTWAKAMAWDLAGNMDTEIERALLLKELTPEQLDFLYPTYPDDRPVIVPNPHITTDSSSTGETTPLMVSLNPALEEARTHILALNALTGGGFAGIGSNNWVIAGERTDTGMPYLANDPHLAAQMPSIWYEVGLHCQPKGPDCDVEVTGFSFAGVPGVIIGHNDHVTWGMTNVGPDVMDLYIEKINPANPNQYEFEGQWVDMQLLTEVIEVAGDDPVEITAQLTRHGPIITEVYGLGEFAEEAGIDLPENYAIALHWTALEPSCVFCAIWRFNIADNWEDFREATKLFAVPSQNLVYADVDGNIGYQTPGNIPIRVEGHDGLLPVPGWTGEYEWQGYIPFDELPFAFNPLEGYIVTANNAVVGPEYSYTISRLWDSGFRAQRIVDMLENAPEAISVAYIQQMQGDNMDLLAEVLVPVLMDISLDDDQLIEARNQLQGWDYQMEIDSAPGALYAAFWKHLQTSTFDDDLPWPGAGGGRMEIIRHLVNEPDSPWWDDQTTPEVETRDDIFRQAFEAAYGEICKRQGKDPTDWSWGDLHTLTVYNQVMSNFPLINKVFDRGPFPTAGGNGIVNATGWDTYGSYEVGWLPSMRMIVDLSDLQNSWTIHTTGQSGHPYHPHYFDMVDPWRMIEYHPQHWERVAIEVDAEAHLRLEP